MNPRTPLKKNSLENGVNVGFCSSCAEARILMVFPQWMAKLSRYLNNTSCLIPPHLSGRTTLLKFEIKYNACPIRSNVHHISHARYSVHCTMERLCAREGAGALVAALDT